MWIRIANKFAEFHEKRLNRSENIIKSVRGLLYLKHPVGQHLLTDYNVLLC